MIFHCLIPPKNIDFFGRLWYNEKHNRARQRVEYVAVPAVSLVNVQAGRRFFLPFAASSYHKRRGAVYCIFSGVWEEKSINERGTPGEKRFFDQKRVNAGGLFYTKTLSFEKNRKSNDFHEIPKFSNPLLENKGKESNQFDWGL
nr:MAG TPA: hypothetical protein [Caudoviricetes sp.]